MAAVGDCVEFVGGGRFVGSQLFQQVHELRVGDIGFVQGIPGARGQLRCSFGKFRVSLDRADVRRASSQATQRAAARRLADVEGSRSWPLQPLRRPKSNAMRASFSAAMSRGMGEERLPQIDLRRAVLLSEDDTSEAESSERRERPHPPSFYCPISRQCMHDPVVLTDGHTYERRYIEQWLEQNDTSPVGGTKLSDKMVFPNHALRNAIEEYFQQILESKREAIRETTSGLFRQQGKFSCNAAVLRTIDSLMQCSILVNSDLSVEMVLKNIMNEAKVLVGAEVASVFLVDRPKRELYSTVNSTNSELRIPFHSGVAGHVASSGQPLIIEDAYADARFNTAVDRKTGFKTQNILCVPIQAWQAGTIGVAQLINKTAAGVLTAEAASGAAPAFTLDDQHFFEVLAGQAGSAIVSSGMFHRMPGLHRSESTRRKAPALAKLQHHDAGAEDELVQRRSPVPELSVTQMGTVRPLLQMAFESWETDTLTLEELTDGRSLSTLTFFLLEQHGLISHFGLERSKLQRFLTEIEAGYPSTNQYHNRAHAASVVHFMHALLVHGGLSQIVAKAAETIEEASRPKFILLACLLAAAVHDFEHNGLSNDFHTQTMTERAIQHNNKSVNEQHHAAEAFKVLLKPENNFLKSISREDFQLLRSIILELVLATDMAEHKSLLDAFKGLVCTEGEGGVSSAESLLVLKIAMKCADLGHLALGWGSHMRWVRRLEEEFFCQGDKEKNRAMPPSFLMDRQKPGVSQSQMGFFNFVVLPLYRSFASTFPPVAPMVDKVEANFARWADVQKELDATA